MMLKTLETKRLSKHPSNEELFDDIKTTNPSFWQEFKASIEEFGILEPLIVNEKTMQVRSGNQRLLAALELEMPEVPVLLVDDEDTEEEIRKMIASNVYRRQIDPFALFGYIGRLRRGHDGTCKKSVFKNGLSKEQTKEIVHKQDTFVLAADIFNTLSEEEQVALQEWFHKKENGERAKSEGELIAKLRSMETKALASDERIAQLEDKNRSKEERERILEDLLEERTTEIEQLKNLDAEEEIATRDAEIRKLEKEKTTLKKKLKEALSKPDLGVFLEGCIRRQIDTNAVLKDLIEYRESLKKDRWMLFVSLLVNAFQTLKEGIPSDALRLEEDHDRETSTRNQEEV